MVAKGRKEGAAEEKVRDSFLTLSAQPTPNVTDVHIPAPGTGEFASCCARSETRMFQCGLTLPEKKTAYGTAGMEVDSESDRLDSELAKEISWAQKVEESLAAIASDCAVRRVDSLPPPPIVQRKHAVSTTASYAKVVKDTPVSSATVRGNFYLPPNHDWSKYLFVKCNTRSRPIYVVDVLEALATEIDTKTVISLGSYRSADVFLLELDSVTTVSRLLQNTKVKVAGGDVEFSPAVDNQVTITLVNVPHALTEIEIRHAMSPWGIVQEQHHLYCQDPRFHHVIINRRRIVVKLHAHTNVDTIPQSVVIASFRIPLFIAGRQPKCYGCGLAGHMYSLCPNVSKTIRSVNTSQNSGSPIQKQRTDNLTVIRDESQVQVGTEIRSLPGTANGTTTPSALSAPPQSQLDPAVEKVQAATAIQQQATVAVVEVCRVAALEDVPSNKRKVPLQGDQSAASSSIRPASASTVDVETVMEEPSGPQPPPVVLKKTKRQQGKKKHQDPRDKSRSPISLRRQQAAGGDKDFTSNIFEPLCDASFDSHSSNGAVEQDGEDNRSERGSERHRDM